MKVKRASIYLFFSICIIAILVIGIYFYQKNIPTGYILTEVDGKLTVFTENGTHIDTIKEADTSILPEADREKLKQGITVFSQEELISLIEDFLC